MQSDISPHQRDGGVTFGAIGGSSDYSVMAETPRPSPELPSPNVQRWTIRRKAAVVIAVTNGVLTPGRGLPTLSIVGGRVAQLATGVRGSWLAGPALDPIAALPGPPAPEVTALGTSSHSAALIGWSNCVRGVP